MTPSLSNTLSVPTILLIIENKITLTISKVMRIIQYTCTPCSSSYAMMEHCLKQAAVVAVLMWHN